MTSISRAIPAFELTFDVLVVGAGACGLAAALAVRDAGVNVIVVERDAKPMGSTAMSTGLIPAAGMAEQAAAGIDDSPQQFLADILRKTAGGTDPALALRMARESAPTVRWLRDVHKAPLSFVDGFLYPGHSRMRMFGTPNRTGAELESALETAAIGAGANLLTGASVEDLYIDGDERIVGVRAARKGGGHEEIGCNALILACSGFGGNAAMVRAHIPEMADAVYHGHPGNQGDAVAWGEAIGAHLADMGAYQGHGGLAVGHGIPILWPLIVEGGVQVNLEGRRFSNEASGYSEQAARVNAQRDHVAWSVFDERLHRLMMSFEDYRDALAAGAIKHAHNLSELAAVTHLPFNALESTLRAVEASVAGAPDPFGRDFTGKPPLRAPFHAAKVTGALFHTQGGLVVNQDGRVQRFVGGSFPNLFAGGGAARGISGPGASGYLAGNGLLTATVLGRLAGLAAAKTAKPKLPAT